jgi:hypothetical protein
MSGIVTSKNLWEVIIANVYGQKQVIVRCEKKIL